MDGLEEMLIALLIAVIVAVIGVGVGVFFLVRYFKRKRRETTCGGEAPARWQDQWDEFDEFDDK